MSAAEWLKRLSGRRKPKPGQEPVSLATRLDNPYRPIFGPGRRLEQLVRPQSERRTEAMEAKRNAVLSFSPAGTTHKVARAVLQGMGGGEFYDVTADGPQLTFGPGDAVAFAVPVFGGRVPDPVTERIRQLSGGGAAAVSVVVYGNRAYDDAMLELADLLTEAGFTVTGGAAFLARHSIVPAIASGRPNREDLDAARDFGRALREKLAAAKEVTPVSLPGNRPYRAYRPSPAHPAANEACIRCGKCAVNCPTGAIPLDDPSKTDPDKCINCMQCVFVCPEQARALPAEAQDALTLKLCRVCAKERRSEIYL